MLLSPSNHHMLHRHLLSTSWTSQFKMLLFRCQDQTSPSSLGPDHHLDRSALFLACTCTGSSLVDRRRRYFPSPSPYSAVPGPFSKQTKPTHPTCKPATHRPLHDCIGPKADSIFSDVVALSQTPGFGTAFALANFSSDVAGSHQVHYPPIGQSIFRHKSFSQKARIRDSPPGQHALRISSVTLSQDHSKLFAHYYGPLLLDFSYALTTFPSIRRLDKFHSMSQCTRQSKPMRQLMLENSNICDILLPSSGVGIYG